MNRCWRLAALYFLLSCSATEAQKDPGLPSPAAGAGGSSGTPTTAGTGGNVGSGGAGGGAGDTGMPAGGSGGGLAGAGGNDGTGGASGNAGTGGASGNAGGASGNAGTGGAGGTVMPPDATGNSVLERNKRGTRDGHYVQPMLTRAMAGRMTQETAFVANFTGNTWASPLYLENGPMNKGIFIAVTLGNDVYALDETTGAIVWTRNLGTPSSGGLGSLNPLGILGTPVIDMTTRTLYVTATLGPGTNRFEVHAMSVDDGKERAGGWPAIIGNTFTAGGLTFDPNPHHSRGAMSLVNGIIYVPFGGRAGDLGAYHGWVVAIDAANPSRIAAWATRGTGGGIWAAGGMASDGDGVFATTGNAIGVPATNQDSEAVVRISGMGTLDRTTNANIFFPADWRALDAADDDMSATSPVVIDVPGATPSSYVVAAAKHGKMYFLNTKMMGGMAGQVAEHIAASATHSLRTGLGSYRTPMGTHVSLTVDANAVCPVAAAGTALMSVLVTPGTPLKTQTVWCVPMIRTGSSCGQTAAPMSTSTDGKNESIVWVMNSGKLLGVNGETGAMVYNGGACTGVREWMPPIAVKGRIIVSGNGHLCAWSAR